MSLRSAVMIVALVAAAAAGLGIPVRATYGAQVSGDEPHYLLTALSLGEDGDLNVDDEIDAGRFRAFHEVPLDPQAQPSPGRRVSPHDPLLPGLLAVPMLLGGWVGAKVAVAVTAVVLALILLLTAVRNLRVPTPIATITIGIFCASAPLAVYGNQVYPELPAAVAVAASIYGLTGGEHRRNAWLVVASVVALPWLSVKYSLVATSIAGLLLLREWRAGRSRDALAILAAFAIAGAHFLVAHQLWYGGWTAYASADHFTAGEFGVIGFHPNYAGRARRLIGLLIDRDFGLAAWQPAYFLMVPAFVATMRRRSSGRAVLIVPALAGWLTATFVALTMQGWWFPGRQVVVILPCLVLAITWWASERPTRMRWVAGLGAIGVLSYGWLVVEGWQRTITWIVDFYDTANPAHGAIGYVLPDYLDVSAWTWVLQAGWLVILGAVALQTWRVSRLRSPSRTAPSRTPIPSRIPIRVPTRIPTLSRNRRCLSLSRRRRHLRHRPSGREAR
jgi:hypothetical protein